MPNKQGSSVSSVHFELVHVGLRFHQITKGQNHFVQDNKQYLREALLSRSQSAQTQV